MKIYTRAAWGARYPAGFGSRKAEKLDRWLHHSAGLQLPESAPFEQDAAHIRQLERTGQTRFGGGISYTFLITPAGRVFEGTGIGRVGAHTQNRNTGSAGICLVGNYETHQVSGRQRQALADLLHHGVEQGWWVSPSLTGGHKDVAATACPGKHAYPLVSGLTPAPTPAPAPTPTPAPAPASKTVGVMAAEVIAGKHGNGHSVRQRSLGVSSSLYAQVRAEVNRLVTGKAAPGGAPRPPAKSAPRPVAKSVGAMASEVIAGKHGNGHETRRKSLGVSATVYAQVRAEVNRRLR